MTILNVYNLIKLYDLVLQTGPWKCLIGFHIKPLKYISEVHSILTFSNPFNFQQKNIFSQYETKIKREVCQLNDHRIYHAEAKYD